MKFVEPSFLISLFHKKSNRYEKSKKIFNNLKDNDLSISYMVIAEVLTVLRKLKVKDELVEKAYNSMINMIVIDDTLYYEKSFKACLTNEIGFFDNLYYILMKDLGIGEIISYDNDFDIFEDINRIH